MKFFGYSLYVVAVVAIANLISWAFNMPIDRVYILMILGNLLNNEWNKINE